MKTRRARLRHTYATRQDLQDLASELLIVLPVPIRDAPAKQSSPWSGRPDRIAELGGAQLG